jgi:hypothetical protein
MESGLSSTIETAAVIQPSAQVLDMAGMVAGVNG